MITAFRQPRLRVAFGVLAAVLCVATIACDRVALLAPAGSTIRLTALASTLPLSGSTNIIAHVIEPAGTPPQRGTLVSFTTTMGSILPIEAETDSGGRVQVIFRAGTQSGTATITALSGGVIVDTESTLKIAIGAAGVTGIGLTALPATIAPGGTSTITATVSDSTGTVIAGIPVTFTTDNGSMNSSVVMTDASGNASAVLTTSKTAKVTASAGVATGSGETATAAPSASVTVAVEPLPTASITASGNAQVNIPVTFTITASPGEGGSTTVRNVTVSFGDGDTQSLGAATGTSTVQHVYRSDGSKTARVTVTDSNGGTTSAATIVFVQTQAPIVSLTYTSGPGVVTTAVNFTATVSPAGTSVAQYVWNFGDGQSQTTFTNTVSHNYATAALPRTATVTITTTTNQTASASTTVTP